MRQLEAVVPRYRAAASALQSQVAVLKERLAAAGQERAQLQEQVRRRCLVCLRYALPCCVSGAACPPRVDYASCGQRVLWARDTLQAREPMRNGMHEVQLDPYHLRFPTLRADSRCAQATHWRGRAQQLEAALGEATAKAQAQEAQALALSTQAQSHSERLSGDVEALRQRCAELGGRLRAAQQEAARLQVGRRLGGWLYRGVFERDCLTDALQRRPPAALRPVGCVEVPLPCTGCSPLLASSPLPTAGSGCGEGPAGGHPAGHHPAARGHHFRPAG